MSEGFTKYLDAVDAVSATQTIRDAYLGLEQLIEVNLPGHMASGMAIERGPLLALLRVLHTRLEHDLGLAAEAIRKADPRP